MKFLLLDQVFPKPHDDQLKFDFSSSSKQGMDIIETLNPTTFSEYLKRYNNTICGRHPIGVMLQVGISTLNSLMNVFLFRFFNKTVQIICIKFSKFQAVNALNARGYRMSFKFLKYAQSSQCCNMSDSSVSYASGSLIFEWKYCILHRSVRACVQLVWIVWIKVYNFQCKWIRHFCLFQNQINKYKFFVWNKYCVF